MQEKVDIRNSNTNINEKSLKHGMKQRTLVIGWNLLLPQTDTNGNITNKMEEVVTAAENKIYTDCITVEVDYRSKDDGLSWFLVLSCLVYEASCPASSPHGRQSANLAAIIILYAFASHIIVLSK